jgi:acetyl esterase/lipase
VSSTISSGEKCSRKAANSSSLVSRPEIVIPSAYASTCRSSGVKSGLVAYSPRCANFSSSIPAACPEAVLMSTQKGHPFRDATRTYTRYLRFAGIRVTSFIAVRQAR